MQSELWLKSQWGCSGLGRKGERSRSADVVPTQSPLESPPEIARADPEPVAPSSEPGGRCDLLQAWPYARGGPRVMGLT